LYNDGLLAADATIRSHPDMAHTLALLVSHHGEIVFERHYRGVSLGGDRDAPWWCRRRA
jgi:hypothetical protein